MRIGSKEIAEGGLTIVAGRPGIGKSTICQSMIKDLLKSHNENGKIALFFLDYTNYYGYTYYASGKQIKHESHWVAFANEHSSINLIHDDGISFERFQFILEYLCKCTPVKYVFIDSVRPLSERSFFNGNYIFDQTKVAVFLAKMARQYNVSIVAEFNADRKLENRDDKRPHIRDLNIRSEALSDVSSFVLVYRDWYYLDDKDMSEETKNEMHIEIVRLNKDHSTWLSDYKSTEDV